MIGPWSADDDEVMPMSRGGRGVQFGTAGRPDMMIVDPGKLRELTDMGFTEEQAEEALLHRHSVADCVTYICNKGELQRRAATPPPPTPPAGTWTAGEGAQAFPPLNGDAFPPLRDDPIGGDEAKGHEPSDDGRPAGPAFGETGFSYSDAARNGREGYQPLGSSTDHVVHFSSAGLDEQAGGNVCDPEQVKTLMELGFSEGKVKSALRHCSDPETAAILLLEGNVESGEEDEARDNFNALSGNVAPPTMLGVGASGVRGTARPRGGAGGAGAGGAGAGALPNAIGLVDPVPSGGGGALPNSAGGHDAIDELASRFASMGIGPGTRSRPAGRLAPVSGAFATGAFDEAFGDGASLGAMGKAILHRANGSGRPGAAASAPIAPAAAWGQQSHHFGKGTLAQRKASRIMRSGRRLSGEHVMLECFRVNDDGAVRFEAYSPTTSQKCVLDITSSQVRRLCQSRIQLLQHDREAERVEFLSQTLQLLRVSSAAGRDQMYLTMNAAPAASGSGAGKQYSSPIAVPDQAAEPLLGRHSHRADDIGVEDLDDVDDRVRGSFSPPAPGAVAGNAKLPRTSPLASEEKGELADVVEGDDPDTDGDDETGSATAPPAVDRKPAPRFGGASRRGVNLGGGGGLPAIGEGRGMDATPASHDIWIAGGEVERKRGPPPGRTGYGSILRPLL